MKRLNGRIILESNEPTPKVGDMLYCHTNLVMTDDDSIEAIAGKSYEITVSNSRVLEIINESKGPHSFELNPSSDSYYGKWFQLYPLHDYDETEGLFDSLNESEENEFDWIENSLSDFDITQPYIVTDNGNVYSQNDILFQYFGLIKSPSEIKQLYKENIIRTPEEGDICYKSKIEWTDDRPSWARKNVPIYYMINSNDGSKFTISYQGVEPYNGD